MPQWKVQVYVIHQVLFHQCFVIFTLRSRVSTFVHRLEKGLKCSKMHPTCTNCRTAGCLWTQTSSCVTWLRVSKLTLNNVAIMKILEKGTEYDQVVTIEQNLIHVDRARHIPGTILSSSWLIMQLILLISLTMHFTAEENTALAPVYTGSR